MALICIAIFIFPLHLPPPHFATSSFPHLCLAPSLSAPYHVPPGTGRQMVTCLHVTP